MPHFNIVKSNNPASSYRIEAVKGTYDLQTSKIEERFEGDINLPEKWNVGLIVGKSGSGKTTIARELFGEYIVSSFEYKAESILDDMPKGVGVNDICKALSCVGFSSPPVG